MRSETKLKILRILFVISLIITILFISNTYAKYQENIATTYNIGIKKWNIKLEEQHFDTARGNNKTGNYIGVNDALKASKTLSQIIEPTLIDSEFVSDNTIAPGREGYLEFDIDYSQVDVPFAFDFSLNQTSSVLDFEQYAFLVNDGVTYNDVTFYNLPAGYKQVEYIESTGTQYIDTGFIPNQDTRVVIDYQLTEVEAGILLGSRSSLSSNSYMIGVSSYDLSHITSYGNTGNQNFITADSLRHVADKNKNLLYLDGDLKLTQTKNEFECPATLELFGAYHSGANGYAKSKAKVYSIKIYDNDTLTREFIPCYKENADGSVNKAGLYDLITDSFYANRGTGDFTIPKDADDNPIVIDMEDIILNKDTDTQDKTNIKAYIRWNDSTENQMDNIEDTKYTLQNNTVNFNVEAVFTQYTGEEE